MLLRLLSCAIVATALVVALTAQPAAAQTTDPALPYEQLDEWGVKCYEYLEGRSMRKPSPAGVVTVFEPNQVAVVLTGTWRDNGQIHILDEWPVRRHTRRLMEHIYASEDPHLSVNQLRVMTLQHFIQGTRENDVLSYQIDGAPGSEPMPTPSVTVGTLMRLFTLLPFEAGREFDARQMLDIPQLELSETPMPIVCQGPETIWLRGLEQDTTKLTYNGYTAWVRNSDRVLLKMEMPGRQYLELLKDGNCCSAERLRKFVDRIQESRGAGAPADAAAPTPAAPANPAIPSPF